MSRKTILFRLTLILLISINLVNNIHRQNEEVRRKYLLYINQQFDMDLRIRRSIFNQQFVLSIEENKKREREKSEKKSLSRGGTIQEEMFVLTFYTSLNEENGYGPITYDPDHDYGNGRLYPGSAG
jgi:hypothetical protein